MTATGREENGLLARLSKGLPIIFGEGFVIELEQRGYLRAGAFVPEVVVDRPDVVKAAYEDYVHAGSDVVVAFQYYANRSKLRVIDREDEVEKFNRTALKLAKEVANKYGVLMAGNICNTGVYDPNDQEAIDLVKTNFREMVQWAVEGGADFILAETYVSLGEAKLALEAILEHGKGLPAVVNMTSTAAGKSTEGTPMPEALKSLREGGATVVGLNCSMGPDTMLPLIRQIRDVYDGPLACIPVPYRCTPEEPTFQTLTFPETGEPAFPLGLDAFLCPRSRFKKLARELVELNLQVIGLCCGARPHMIRELAEGLGRTPPASKFSPNMEQHISNVKHSYTKSAYHEFFFDGK